MSQPIHFEQEPGARPGAPPMRVPKGALYMAAALIVVVFALAISARVFGFGAFRESTGAVVEQRALLFSDQQGGGIRVLDARTKQVAAELAPGTNGFLRGALRALTRSRELAGIGRDVPFTLTQYADGRLVLEDPATRQHVTISSFGPTQVASFDRLLLSRK